MAVPANRVGVVIGKGGDTIRMIKQQSGCDIELDKNATPVDSPEKIFVIRGKPDRIQIAQQMINEKVAGNQSQHHGSSSSANQDQSYGYSYGWVYSLKFKIRGYKGSNLILTFS